MGTLTANRVPSVKEINLNFIIKWRHADEKSNWNRLIGGGRYEEKFGSEYMEKHFERAMSCGERKTEIRVRGRYIITFTSR